MYFTNDTFALYSKPLSIYMFSINLGIILLRIVYSKYFCILSFIILVCNSNHFASSLVLIKRIYQAKCSYYIIKITEVLSTNHSLMIKLKIREGILVSSVKLQNINQHVLQYGLHNLWQIVHNPYYG